jgi:hypothetical protein
MKKKIKIESFVVQKEDMDELKNHIGGYDSYYTDVTTTGTNGCTGGLTPGGSSPNNPPRHGGGTYTSTECQNPPPGGNDPGDGQYDSNYTALYSGC